MVNIIFGKIIKRTLQMIGKEISNRENQIDHSHTEKHIANQTKVKYKEEKVKKPETMANANAYTRTTSMKVDIVICRYKIIQRFSKKN